MPEGPSIYILKEELQPFVKKTITSASGYADLDFKKLKGQKILSIESWGKHLLIVFKKAYVRIHLLMFGTYRINERKEANPKLTLKIGKDELNFYTCSVKYFEEDPTNVYDFDADVMSTTWSPRKALKKLRSQPQLNVCDALLDQQIFSGVGNIIKNEVLFRIRVHPKNTIGNLPDPTIKNLVKEAANYTWDFYEWKKINQLKKHWLIHTKKICPRCHIPAFKEYIGKTKRRTFYCDNCQIIFKPKKGSGSAVVKKNN